MTNITIEYVETEWAGWLYPNGTIDFACLHPSTHTEEVDFGGLVHTDPYGDLDWRDDWRTVAFCDDCEEELEQDDYEPDYYERED